MNRDEVLETLRKHKQVLRERFDVTGLALYGSFARNQATPESDVDILVRFGGPATSKTYFGTLFYIEDLLGRRIDLVTDKALRAEFRPFVEQEALEV
jgi:predicted nucleotidyltransferase